MHKKSRVVSAGLLSSILFLTGCAMVQSPVNGFFYTEVKAPMGVTSNGPSSKVGRAMSSSVLGLIATGDSSIEAAAKNGKITKIHHVDYEAKNILGIYSTFTTVVYGE